MSPVDTAVLALVLAIFATRPAFTPSSRHRAPDADGATRTTALLLGLCVRD